MFHNVAHMARIGDKKELPALGETPYCMRKFLQVSQYLPPTTLLRDQWSIGMIILEVLVGTEIVLPLSTFQ